MLNTKYLCIFSILIASCATTTHNGKSDEKAVFFQALGSEPRWSVEVMKKEIAFSSEDFYNKKNFAIVASEDGEFMSYQNVEKEQIFSLVLEEKKCLDHVSIQSMPYVATFTFGDITYLGCAQKIAK